MTYLPLPGRVHDAGKRPCVRASLACAIAIFLLLLGLVPHARAQPIELSPAQRQWLAAHKVIRVAPDPDLAPIDGIDTEGHQRGLSADYLKLIAARTALELRAVRLTTRSDAPRPLAAPRVHLVPPAPPGAAGT